MAPDYYATDSITPTLVPDTSDSWSITSTEYCDKVEEEPDYIREEREDEIDCWHVPRKIPMPIKYFNKRINPTIRNQLIYKIRLEEI